MRVEKLEERWTPTTIQAAFVCNPSSCISSRQDNVHISLPLLHLGWTFTLSSTPKKLRTNSRPLRPSQASRDWNPAVFSFHRHGSKVPWGNTSMHAQVSLADREDTAEQRTPLNDVGRDPTPLGAMKVVLQHTPSAEVPLTKSCTLASLWPIKISLTVTISECPFANGLFTAISSQDDEAEAQAQLVRQCGDRVLSRSLVTGKLFDLIFLTCTTRSTSANTGKLFGTYASLSVLEEHINLLSAKIKEEWISVLAAQNHPDVAGAKHIKEILCPNDYEYELDSDFEDEDEASSPVELCASPPSRGRDLAVLEGRQSENSTERSGSSFSSELGEDSDQGSFDDQPEEVIIGPGKPTHLPSVAAADHEQTVLVRFAAHRTWYTFLWYCYTDRLEFNQLKSQLDPGARQLRTTHQGDGPPSCSPKSMYRLADLIDDTALKAKALAAIKERMTKVNILDELFSVFTSKYPDVREVQLDVLMKYRKSPEIKEAFLSTMSKFSNIPHAGPTLSALYDRLAA